MKKSKFLQSSKDMLHKSFNPAKCKTSLKLAGSRLKLLRNKKEVQVKQMKREIAQLLESGQDQTARIRVEHVIREEKMMAAYDLIQIYCELIAARLPIIESQKNCPIDLNEAIASIIFASPRCGDIPELLDVRKHFTAKYGKDFTTAAIELRPQCGVSRLLVEKLSAVAPDGPTKIKILSAIAEEHNVQWEHKSFDEKTSSPSDLLDGPSTFEKLTEPHVAPQHLETPYVQAPSSNHQVHSSPVNFSQQEPKTSTETAKLSSVQTSCVSSSFQPETKPPEDERAERFHTDGDSMSPNKQRWNMEFKDAASAARAAAESAERASMAARAAAELSTHERITRQHSAQLRKSGIRSPKAAGFERDASPKFAREELSEETSNRSSTEHSNLPYEQSNMIKPKEQKASGSFKEHGRGDRKDYSQSASLKSKASDVYSYSLDHDVPIVDKYSSKNSFRSKEEEQKAFGSFKENGRDGRKDYIKSTSLKSKASGVHNYSLDHDFPVVDEYSSKHSFKEVSKGETSTHKDSFKYEADNENGYINRSENSRDDTRIRKQLSNNSSRSASSISSNVNIFANSEDLKFENDGVDHSVGITRGVSHGEASQANFHESGAVFDKSDSERSANEFDMGVNYDEQDLEFHLQSYGQKSPENLASNTDSWLPKSSSNKTLNSTSPFFTRKNSSSDVSEKLESRDVPEQDNHMPVAFDASDGPTSESDEDMSMHMHTVAEDFEGHPSKQDKVGQSIRSGLEDKRTQYVGERKKYSLSSDDELNTKDLHKERKQGRSSKTGYSENLKARKSSTERPAVGFEDSPMDSGDVDDELDSGLDFGKLTGGLRHKAYSRAPYLKNNLDVPSSLKKKIENNAKIDKSAAHPAVENRKKTMVSDLKKSSTTYLSPESDSGSSEDETSRRSLDHKQKLETTNFRKRVETKSKSRASNTVFGSDDSDLEELPQTETVNTKSHLRGGISRRTKVPPTSSGTNHHSRTRFNSEIHDPDSGIDRKPTTSYVSETPKKSESQHRNSDKLENDEQPASTKAPSRPGKSSIWGPPEQPGSAKASSRPGKSSFWGPPEQPDSAEATSFKRPGWRSSETCDTDENAERKPKNSSIPPETTQDFQSSRRNSGQLASPEQHKNAKVESKPTRSSLWGPPEQPSSGKSSSLKMQEPKIVHNAPVVKEPSSSQVKGESPRNENPKAATLNKTNSIGDDGNKKASHVLPKLPDYDTLVQSLRLNRS